MGVDDLSTHRALGWALHLKGEDIESFLRGRSAAILPSLLEQGRLGQ
jgi:hypothetical protein